MGCSAVLLLRFATPAQLELPKINFQPYKCLKRTAINLAYGFIPPISGWMGTWGWLFMVVLLIRFGSQPLTNHLVVQEDHLVPNHRRSTPSFQAGGHLALPQPLWCPGEIHDWSSPKSGSQRPKMCLKCWSNPAQRLVNLREVQLKIGLEQNEQASATKTEESWLNMLRQHWRESMNMGISQTTKSILKLYSTRTKKGENMTNERRILQVINAPSSTQEQ